MASPVFRHPVGGPYTTTLTFRDVILVNVSQPRIPIQSLRRATGGQTYVYQPSANVIRNIPIEVINLPTDDEVATFSGKNSLETFLDTTVVWSFNLFEYIDENGANKTVRYISGFETLEQDQRRDLWSGQLLLSEDIP